jgi:FixJ family two-component response regulator
MSNAAAVISLVDDDAAIRKAVNRLLTAGGHTVAAYSCAEDFLKNHDPEAPGCAVVDLGLPGLDGFAVQAGLRADGCLCPVIFLTGRGDIPASVRAMKAGAVDFLTKPVDSETLLAAVAAALEQDASQRRLDEQQRAASIRVASLTPREAEVMHHVVAGLLNKQIAAELGTVEKTVKVHRSRMMEKMGVRTVADLVRSEATARAYIGPKSNYQHQTIIIASSDERTGTENSHRGR